MQFLSSWILSIKAGSPQPINHTTFLPIHPFRFLFSSIILVNSKESHSYRVSIQPPRKSNTISLWFKKDHVISESNYLTVTLHLLFFLWIHRSVFLFPQDKDILVKRPLYMNCNYAAKLGNFMQQLSSNPKAYSHTQKRSFFPWGGTAELTMQLPNTCIGMGKTGFVTIFLSGTNTSSVLPTSIVIMLREVY